MLCSQVHGAKKLSWTRLTQTLHPKPIIYSTTDTGQTSEDENSFINICPKFKLPFYSCYIFHKDNYSSPHCRVPWSLVFARLVHSLRVRPGLRHPHPDQDRQLDGRRVGGVALHRAARINPGIVQDGRDVGSRARSNSRTWGENCDQLQLHDTKCDQLQM